MNEASPARVIAGVDIGGTKIGLAVGTTAGEIIASARFDNDPVESPDRLLAMVFDELRAMSESSAVAVPEMIGIACPGPVSYARGCLLEVPNMPRWQHYPLIATAQRLSGRRCVMMNDANASVLAESYWGAAQDVSNAVFYTMSTGMGAGLLFGGQVYEGALALAGEIGHIRLAPDGPVGFGKRGSVEGFASGPGIVQLAMSERRRYRQLGEPTALESCEPLHGEFIFECARAGDEAARHAIQRSADAVGQLSAMLVDLLNLDAIIFGTIGSAHFDLIAPRVREVIDREALAVSAAHVELRPSGLRERGDLTALAVARRDRGEAPIGVAPGGS